jgi:hypothetical protein
MKTALFLGTALALLCSGAQAQQMSYEQWVGPQVAPTEDNIGVTWQGATRYGYEVRLHNYDTGVNGVLWQSAPGAQWRFKASNGNTATASADLTQWQDTTPQYQALPPRQTLSPQRYAPQPYNPPQGGYSTAAYPYQYQPNPMQMFGMFYCAASGRC